MRKYVLALVIVIAATGLSACEFFGFQRATLKITNPKEIQDVIEQAALQQDAVLSNNYFIFHVKFKSDNVGIADNKGDKFYIDLAQLKTWKYSLEWFGYTDGVFKLEVSYMGIPFVTTDSYHIKFGETLTIYTTELFKNTPENSQEQADET